ncbi:MAG: DNA repair protein RadC [Archangiaceae bacterium]|nr:DNA repair protein RadC [Archangiaceae bacterium]
MNPTLERLFRLSARALSDSELLAVLLDTDALADEDLRAVQRTPVEDWLDDPRLSPHQSARLLVALELGRRSLQQPERKPPRLRTPADTHAFIRPHLLHLAHEEMHVLCLGPSNLLLRHRCVARGSATHCVVDPRDVFAPALAARATALVLVHNHPSGDPTPSSHDVALTRQLREAGRALCIRLADHLVVGDATWCSMLAAGLLDSESAAPPQLMEARCTPSPRRR